jgi:hypothetical protein
LSHASHCAILGCFVQIRTASVMQAAAGHMLRKFRPSPSNQPSGSVAVKPCGVDLPPRKSCAGPVWLDARQCECRAALALGESAILDEWPATRKLTPKIHLDLPYFLCYCTWQVRVRSYLECGSLLPLFYFRPGNYRKKLIELHTRFVSLPGRTTLRASSLESTLVRNVR